MARAEISSAHGTKITIEGTPREVANIVATLEGLRSPTPRSRKDEKKKEAKREKTASDRVAALKEEGFFDKPKRLADVATRLEQNGYLYPVTTLSGVMLSLVQKKILNRKKNEGVWVYGKR